MKISGVLESCLYVDDLITAKLFYARIFGFELISEDPERHIFFRCGQGVLLLFNPSNTSTVETSVKGAKIPLHGTKGAGHVAFKIENSEISEWREFLKKSGVAIESEVDWPQGGHSIYFRDPAGNSLELATPQIWGF